LAGRRHEPPPGGGRGSGHGPLRTRHKGKAVHVRALDYPAPRTFVVRSPEGQYRILLGRRLLAQLGELAAGLRLGRAVAVVSDSNVAPLYMRTVLDSLGSACFDPRPAVIPAGEEHKCLGTVDFLVERFLDL